MEEVFFKTLFIKLEVNYFINTQLVFSFLFMYLNNTCKWLIEIIISNHNHHKHYCSLKVLCFSQLLFSAKSNYSDKMKN